MIEYRGGKKAFLWHWMSHDLQFHLWPLCQTHLTVSELHCWLKKAMHPPNLPKGNVNIELLLFVLCVFIMMWDGCAHYHDTQKWIIVSVHETLWSKHRITCAFCVTWIQKLNTVQADQAG